MTQTLRRELIQVIEKDLNDYIATGYSYLGETVPTVIVEKIADHVLSVSGIKNSPVSKKYSDPNWDLLHGKTSDKDAFDWATVFNSIAERLEKGLLRNEFPQTYEAQKVYRWIYEQEQKGQKLEEWIKWAMEGNRANYSYVYHTNPTFIKRDWIQAFNKPTPSGQRKFERLNND